MTAVASPAQVIGHPGRLDTGDQPGEVIQVCEVERVGRSDRERDPVQHHRGIGTDPLEHGERTAARDHEVLGDDLEPVGALTVEDARVVLRPQTDSVAERGTIGKHRGRGPGHRPGPLRGQLRILPCFCSHSAFGTSTMPLPLHEF